MNRIKTNQGYTMIEMTVAAGVVAFIVTCTLSMMINAMTSVDFSTIQQETDSDAVIAMQRIVSDVREAKSYVVLSNSNQLELTMPVTNTDKSYNRTVADTAHPIDYYRADSTGIPGHDGNFLWRSQTGTAARIVGDNINDVEFTPDDAAAGRAVKITIHALHATTRGTRTAYKSIETNLIERVVYLRNN